MKNFNETYSLGQAGKKLVMQYFMKHGYEVRNLENDIGYRKMNIDFAISIHGKTRYVCVRTDTRLCVTENIVLETLIRRRNTNSLSQGWFYTCKAELLVYLDAYTGNFYVFDWAWLKELVNAGKLGYQHVFYNQIDMNCLGQAQLIPIQDLVSCEAFKFQDKINVFSLQQFQWAKPAPF